MDQKQKFKLNAQNVVRAFRRHPVDVLIFAFFQLLFFLHYWGKDWDKVKTWIFLAAFFYPVVFVLKLFREIRDGLHEDDK